MRKLEDWVLGLNDVEQGEKSKRELKKNDNSFGGLWDNIKETNILIIGITVTVRKKKWAENIVKDIIAEKEILN